jgi:hypothetical protein
MIKNLLTINENCLFGTNGRMTLKIFWQKWQNFDNKMAKL